MSLTYILTWRWRILYVFLIFSMGLSAQNISCVGGVQISLDDDCQVIIEGHHVITSEREDYDPQDYRISIKPKDGSPINSIEAGSDINSFSAGTAGTFIRFVEPGKYQFEVIDLVQNQRCWGHLYIEDKLPPYVDGTCQCPDTSMVVSDSCTFSCNSIEAIMGDSSFTTDLNPQFVDNCDGEPEITFEDEVIPANGQCGGFYLIRTWKSKVTTAHGEKYLSTGCRQRFFFESRYDTILSPKKKVVVPCGTSTHPDSLRDYFSNSDLFPNNTRDSVIICVYPYIIDTMGTDTIIDAVGPEDSAAEKYCKLLSYYTDSPKTWAKGDCPNAYKFVRYWEILDWCTKESYQFSQIISVEDNEAPTFRAPDKIEPEQADAWFCSSELMVPPPIDSTLRDNCSPKDSLIWRAKVHIEGKVYRIAADSNDYKLRRLPKGMHDLIYEVIDECGNIGRDTVKITIIDGHGPNVLLKDKLNISLSNGVDSCVAKVFPYNFDLGSEDACGGKVSLCMRRKGDTVWGEYIKFSTSDITHYVDNGTSYGEHDVEIKVCDQDSNCTLGWTKARIEDKNVQRIIKCGRDSFFLDCSYDFYDIVSQPPYAPKATLRMCKNRDMSVDYAIIEGNISKGCNIGHATVAYFAGLNRRDTICIKYFELKDTGELKIIWPAPEKKVSCLEDLSEYDTVLFTGTGCVNPDVKVEDQIFDGDGGQDFCRKVVRKYTVYDWCRLQPGSSDSAGVYRFYQSIIVEKETEPEILCHSVETSFDMGCGVTDITMTAVVHDPNACDETLSWHALLDIGDDGTVDTVYLPEVMGDSATVIIANILPGGVHSLTWRVRDGCGHVTSQSCTITVEDRVAPSISCITNVSTAVMNTNGEVAIWASDFIANSSGSGCRTETLRYSFSGTDSTVSSLTFTCEDIVNGMTGIVELEVYVWDEAGNTDFCQVQLRIDDNAQVCEDIAFGSANIAGKVHTYDGLNIESAVVQVEKTASHTMTEYETSVSGEFMFEKNPMRDSYMLKTSKDDKADNGVTTLDLILLQRHILGLTVIEEPELILAADVNMDQRVNTSDMVEMRRLILGKTTSFSAGKSWLFIDKNTTFEDVFNPWPVQEEVYLEHLQKETNQVDFIGIKLGDINADVVANSIMANGRHANRPRMDYVIEDQYWQAGDIATVSIPLSAYEAIAGFQLAWEIEGATLQDVKINGATLASDHYQWKDNQLTLLYTAAQPEEQILVQMTLAIEASGYLSDRISELSGSLLSSQMYVGENLEVQNLHPHFWRVESFQFNLEQNKPNPFKSQTVIPYELGEDGMIEFVVFDMTGKEVYRIQEHQVAGKHEIVVNRNELTGDGVMYYQLSDGVNVATRKMILID